MKTKLLKKVRKNFEIIRIDKLASNAEEYKICATKKLGLPFFIVYNKSHIDSYRYGIVFKTFQEAKNYILNIILITYKEKFKHDDGKQEKVWYNK
jgi:hypothetical protein